MLAMRVLFNSPPMNAQSKRLLGICALVLILAVMAGIGSSPVTSFKIEEGRNDGDGASINIDMIAVSFYLAAERPVSPASTSSAEVRRTS